MKKQLSLSEIVILVQRQKIGLSPDRAKILLDSREKPDPEIIRNNHPKKLNRLFKPLKLIVMISVISLVTTLSLLVFNHSGPEINQAPKDIETDSRNSVLFDTIAAKEAEERTDTIPIKETEKPSDEVFKSIKQDQKDTEEFAKEIIVNEPKDSIIDSYLQYTIILDRSYMPCFGLRETPDSMIYAMYSQDRTVEFHVSRTFGETKAVGYQHGSDYLGEQKSVPMFTMTDENLGTVSIPNPTFEIHMDSSLMLSDWFEACIPIKFIGDPGQISTTTTFWFYPCDELFNCLPDSIGETMRQEFNVNVQPVLMGSEIGKRAVQEISGVLNSEDSSKTEAEDPVPCQYFPSFCEGLPGLDNLNIYPNPASDQITIDVILSRPKSIQYTLIDLSGRVLNDELAWKKYTASGRFTETLDLSILKSGLYLLVLTDNQGARMTKRILKN